MSDINARREERIKRQYAELRAARPDAFRKCVEYAEGVILNHHRALSKLTEAERSKLGADFEVAMVTLLCEVT